MATEFRRWWDAHHALGGATGTKTFRHALVGDVTVHWEILTSAADPDQQLIVMTAETGSPSHDALLGLLPTVAEGGDRTFAGAWRGGDLRSHDEWMQKCLRQSDPLLDVPPLPHVESSPRAATSVV